MGTHCQFPSTWDEKHDHGNCFRDVSRGTPLRLRGYKFVTAEGAKGSRRPQRKAEFVCSTTPRKL